MTADQEKLKQALAQLQRMYEALAQLRERTQGRGQFFVLAEGPLDEIRRLESSVAALSGRSAVEEHAADIWMQVAGAELTWPEAPTSILTNLLDALRKGVQVAAEWLLKGGELSTRPTKELKRACDLRVLAMEPGSVRVALRLPEVEPGTEESATVVRDALGKYLAVATWAASDASGEGLEELIEVADLRRVLLTEVKRLVPRPRGDVESVDLYGRAMPRAERVRLTRKVHARIDAAIDAAEREQVERHEGDLREIDLDNRTFTLRNVSADNVFQIPCQFGPDLYDSALDALDRRVEVTGIRQIEVGRSRSGRLSVTRLVILDEDETEPRANQAD